MAMPKHVITPANPPPPLAPYSSGTIGEGKPVYVSGMVPIDASGATVGVGDVRAQTRQVLKAIKDVVEAAGGTMDSIAYNMIFLKSMDDYAVMNEVYAEYFPGSLPARFTISTDLVRADFLVEITSIAYV